jgi:hypothetical protein
LPRVDLGERSEAMEKIQGQVYDQFKALEVGDWSQVRGGAETISYQGSMTGCYSDDGFDCDEDPICY